jgi:hypothetical protein
VTLRDQTSEKGRLSVILQFLSKYIHECIEKDKTLLKQSFTSPKAFLYQMYFIINKLDEHRLAKMDFLVNFGVTLETIRTVGELIADGGTYEDVREVLKRMAMLQILKVYKYFSWGDKKLHQLFFIENKDDISEDLLSDFKDPDSEQKFK